MARPAVRAGDETGERPDIVRICITGANAGIGRAAARVLAARGAAVLMVCRNRQRGEEACDAIRSETGNAAVTLEVADLSSQSSIRACCGRIAERYEILDALIHNAAAFDLSRKERVLTDEGMESIWATNHLGPVLMTELLLPLLKRSGSGRIITVASKGLLLFPFLKVNLSDSQYEQRRFSVPKAYYQSKLAQVGYTAWLDRRFRGTALRARCVRVGNVRLDITRYPAIPDWMKRLYALKMKLALAPEAMAETYATLALERSLPEALLLDYPLNPISLPRGVRSAADQDALMQLSFHQLDLPITPVC